MAKNNKKTAKPVKKAAKPAPKKASKPAAKKAAKPVAKAVAKKAKVKPAAKKAIKPLKPVKAIAKKTVKPAAKKAVKPVKPAAKKIVKAVKPAAKKVVKPTKPVAKKIVKPAKPAATKAKDAKKVVKPAKPAAVKKAAPSKQEKPVAKKISATPVNNKKDNKSKIVKPEKKELKKDVKSGKPGKEESKKVKAPVDDDIAGEDLDIEDGLLETDLEVDAEIDDEEDIIEEEEPKKAKGRKRKDKSGEKKHYDSESFVRKQIVKVDLTRTLVKKNLQEQPKPFVNTNDNRTRYSDAELAEFKELILQKLTEAKTDYELLKQTLSHADDHGTDDTSPTFKLLEDGSDVLSKEETAQLAARQEKYIINLQNALVRIENKTYGVCRISGKLIPKERLRSVPHATLSIDAKLNQNS